MFNLREFIMQGFKDAIGRMADYQVILNAAGWQEKGVLTVDDLAELQECINIKNTPEPQEETPIPDPLPDQEPEVPQEPEQTETIVTEQA